MISFKQLVCIAGSIIFGIQTWVNAKTILYQFLRRNKNLYDHILTDRFGISSASFCIQIAISLKSMKYQFLHWFGNLYEYPLTAEVVWTVMTVHLKTSFVALWFIAEFLSVHEVWYLARWTRNDFSLPAVASDFHKACFIDDVSRGSNRIFFC